jgi:23S rRNA pseudouridine1911/1915/1917 synthase
MVHRLDKDTTGLIVVAKNEVAQDSLSKQFSGRTVLKKYVALVHGVTDEDSGKVEAPLARDPRNRLKMAIVNNGRGALSLWKVRERFARFTLLEVEIKTGRTHQIRVHLAHIGHPVVGDATYNSGRDNSIADMKLKKALKEMNRFFLHAETLGFDHPETGKRMEFTAPLPEELENFLNSLR